MDKYIEKDIDRTISDSILGRDRIGHVRRTSVPSKRVDFNGVPAAQGL